MSTRSADSSPQALCRAWPEPLLALCADLERGGVATFVQGEGLLDAWLGASRARGPSWALVCLASAERLLALEPAAVVTAESARRLTRATAAGPVDLIPAGAHAIEATLAGFGLAPLALAYRPATGEWSDPGDLRDRLAKRELPLVGGDAANPFRAAPRRYWIAAQLMAEYGLEATPELVDAAREALPEVVTRLPEGAPARRALARILASAAPARALAFLRETGVSAAVLPELDAAMEERVEALPRVPALRWAAFLRGSGTARALARLRMPQDLARRITRIEEAHPLDRTLASGRDAPIRRALNRLSREEIAGLLDWRRAELAAGRGERAAGDAGSARARLARIEAALARVDDQAEESRSLRGLALDGADVMRILGSGPGRHVGRALAHLARFAAEHPERNEPGALAAELAAWRATDPGRGA